MMDANERITNIIEDGGPDYVMTESSAMYPTGNLIPVPMGMELNSYKYPVDSGNRTERGILFEDLGKSGTFEENQAFFQALSRSTGVEWGYAGKEGETGGTVFSSHSQGSVEIPDAVLGKGYDSLYHSHSTRKEVELQDGIYSDDDKYQVSDSDRATQENFEENHGFNNFGVYIADEDSYINY